MTCPPTRKPNGRRDVPTSALATVHPMWSMAVRSGCPPHFPFPQGAGMERYSSEPLSSEDLVSLRLAAVFFLVTHYRVVMNFVVSVVIVNLYPYILVSFYATAAQD